MRTATPLRPERGQISADAQTTPRTLSGSAAASTCPAGGRASAAPPPTACACRTSPSSPRRSTRFSSRQPTRPSRAAGQESRRNGRDHDREPQRDGPAAAAVDPDAPIPALRLQRHDRRAHLPGQRGVSDQDRHRGAQRATRFDLSRGRMRRRARPAGASARWPPWASAAGEECDPSLQRTARSEDSDEAFARGGPGRHAVGVAARAPDVPGPRSVASGTTTPRAQFKRTTVGWRGHRHHARPRSRLSSASWTRRTATGSGWTCLGGAHADRDDSPRHSAPGSGTTTTTTPRLGAAGRDPRGRPAIDLTWNAIRADLGERAATIYEYNPQRQRSR